MNAQALNNPQAIQVVKACVDDNGQPYYQWQDAISQQLHSGSATDLLNNLPQLKQLELIVPAQYCSLKHYAFDSSESKVLRQTLPYSLEDELLTDVDELHFALGEPQQGKVAVAIINTELVANWLGDLRAAANTKELDIKRLSPELLAMPWLEQQWTLCVDDSEEPVRYILRSSAYQGFAVPAALFSQALSLLIAEQGLPDSIVLYSSDESREAIKAALPESLRPLVLWQSGSYWLLITAQQQLGADSEPLSLLQGLFARGLAWRKYWLQWRKVVALFAVVVVAQLAYAYTENYRLDAKNLKLRSQIEAAYRSAIPKGAVINPEKQLKRKVAALQGGNGEGFVHLLAKVAAITHTVPGFTLQSMNYSENQSEMRLTVLANSFKEVESVRSQLQQQGVQAELTGSSSEGGKTRARLRIRG